MGQWKTLSTKIAYETPFIRVEESQVVRPDGSPGIYSVVRKTPFCAVIAINEAGKICLVRQVRFTIQEECIELPMGNTDGQEPLIAAKRELQEETGLVAKEWQHIGEFYPSNGISNSKGIIFTAKGLTQTNENSQAEEGITAVEWKSLSDIEKMIAAGQLPDGPTITALYLAKLKGFLPKA